MRADKLTEFPSPMDEMFLPFAGPFSWFGTGDAACVYSAKEVHKSGIYLGTVPRPDGQLVYYVGETGRTFGKRLRQHHAELVSARYHIYSASEFAHGEKVCLWPGHYDLIDRKTDEECQVNRERLSEQIREMMCVIRLFLAAPILGYSGPPPS